MTKNFSGILGHALTAALLMSLATGCTKGQPRLAAVAPAPGPLMGGIDGTGGNLDTVADSDLEKIVSVFPDIFVRGSYRAIMMWSAIVTQDIENRATLPQEERDPKEEAIERLTAMFEALYQGNTTRTEGVEAAFKNGGIRLILKEQCYEHDHQPADGAADNDGNICISKTQFRKIPLPHLIPELFSLVGHEVSHVYGFGESDAELLQWTLKTLGQKVFSRPNNWIEAHDGYVMLARTAEYLRNSINYLKNMKATSPGRTQALQQVCASIRDLQYTMDAARDEMEDLAAILYSEFLDSQILTQKMGGFCEPHLVRPYYPAPDGNNPPNELGNVEQLETDLGLLESKIQTTFRPIVFSWMEGRRTVSGQSPIDSVGDGNNWDNYAKNIAFDWNETLEKVGIRSKLPWE